MAQPLFAPLLLTVVDSMSAIGKWRFALYPFAAQAARSGHAIAKFPMPVRPWRDRTGCSTIQTMAVILLGVKPNGRGSQPVR